MIVRKLISIEFLSTQKYIDNFSPHLALRNPRNNGLVTRKTGCPHSEILIVINSENPKNNQCHAGNLFANKDISVE